MADTPSQSNAIYHQQSPYLVIAGKIYAGVTGLMVLLAILFCFIRGAKVDGTFNLLGINLIISTVVIGFLMWWYRTGDLAPDKLWFIVLVASIILFQCITTDIYVFNHEKTPAKPPTTTRGPTITAIPITSKHTNSSQILKSKVKRAGRRTNDDVMFAKLPSSKRIQKKDK